LSKAKKKIDVNSEEFKVQQHRDNLIRIEERLIHIPEPTVTFEIGESVRVGSLEDEIVFSILHGGKILEIDYTSVKSNYGNPIREEHQKGYWTWTDTRKKNDNVNSLIENDDIRLNYSQTHLRGLLTKVYHFGVDFNPDYQRDYVWDKSDKVKLIDAIYKNVDIGKFAFVRVSDRKWEDNGHIYSYEILDGKQRLRAILDYYENRFPYKGFYFNDLSRRDQNHMMEYSVNVAEVSELTYEQTLRYFLMLNTSGRIMSEEHLDKVRQLLDQETMK
jgi:hypothetical protein